jgi:hypothetical protein
MNGQYEIEDTVEDVRASAAFDPGRFPRIFRSFYELENNADELLSFRAGQVPYWGIIRLVVLVRLMDRLLGESSAGDIYLSPRKGRLLRTANYILTSLWRTPFRYANREVVFFCSGVNQTLRDGRYFNTRPDYFAGELRGRRILLIEGADDLQYDWPRAMSPVCFKGGITVPGAIMGRLRRVPSGDPQVSAFMALLERTLGDDLTAHNYAEVRSYLCNRIFASATYQSIVSRLLDRLNPRLLLLENTHSGLDTEVLMAARERGITTAEYQHGAINPVCPFHNFHPRLLAAGYDKCLPDYFLSYGDFWNHLVNTSAKCVSIGNPHVASVRGLSKRPAPTESLYFLSSANSPQLYLERIRELRAEGFSVLFRPHPVERPLMKERYGDFFERHGVRVDMSEDFYDELHAHALVLGDGRSTSIFEAYAITGGRACILEMNEKLSEDLPKHAFLKVIRSVRELRPALREFKDRSESANYEQLFAPNWRERFARFISDTLEK